MIDYEALKNLQDLIGGRRADLIELVRDFLDDAPVQLAAMIAAAEVGDADTVRRAAHSLKSNGRDLGAVLLAQLCADLESDLGTANLCADMSGRAREIAELWPLVAAMFEAEITRDGPPS